MSKTALWDRLGKTDPSHTKQFKKSGGFSGTAIKPMWSYRRMTEEFGPCGDGWGVNEPSFQVVAGADGETLVYCTVSIWHGKRENVVFGVGGDKVIAKFSSGSKSDDEAFKKAFTDAITNALKLIGVGADVHMGMFDDSKYVNTVKAEIAAQNAPEPDASYVKFVETIREIIRVTSDPKALREWWSSDEQKKMRRDFQVTESDLRDLMSFLKTRLEGLETKKAAA